MALKLFIAVLLLGTTLAQKCDIHIREKGESFVESINVENTEHGKIVITRVPRHQHGRLSAVEHICVKDMDLEIDIVKEFGPKKRPVCLVHSKTSDEPTEEDVEVAMKHGGCGELPKRGTVTHYNYLPKHCKGTLNADEMAMAEKMCGDLPMICGHEMKEGASKEEHEKRAVELAIDHMEDEEKRAVVREFIACDMATTMNLMTCDYNRLEANCHFTTKFCTYGLTCPLDANNGYWMCQYNHKFAQLKCCDYKCRN